RGSFLTAGFAFSSAANTGTSRPNTSTDNAANERFMMDLHGWDAPVRRGLVCILWNRLPLAEWRQERMAADAPVSVCAGRKPRMRLRVCMSPLRIGPAFGSVVFRSAKEYVVITLAAKERCVANRAMPACFRGAKDDTTRHSHTMAFTKETHMNRSCRF